MRSWRGRRSLAKKPIHSRLRLGQSASCSSGRGGRHMRSPRAPWLLGVVLTLSNAVPQRSSESCLDGNCGRPFMHAGAPYTGHRRLEGPQGLSRHYALLQQNFACCQVGAGACLRQHRSQPVELPQHRLAGKRNILQLWQDRGSQGLCSKIWQRTKCSARQRTAYLFTTQSPRRKAAHCARGHPAPRSSCACAWLCGASKPAQKVF